MKKNRTKSHYIQIFFTYLDIDLVVRNVSSIAFLERSRICAWRLVPPAARGSYSFSPRLGMTGRAEGGLLIPNLFHEDTSGKVKPIINTNNSFVQSNPPSSSSDCCSSSSSKLLSVLQVIEPGASSESSIEAIT